MCPTHPHWLSIALFFQIFANSAFERCKYHSSGSLNPGCRELTPELEVVAGNLLVILADLQR